MVKSHRSKRHHKKHRGGEGEDNSVLNMDEPVSATTTAPVETAPVETAPAMPVAAPETAMPVAAPAEEEKKGWFTSLFGGSRTKRVRFRMTRKHRRSTNGTKSKRSSAKRSSAKSKRGGSKNKSHKKRKGSSNK